MKFKRLIAIAVAGAFAVPFAALAQGGGGTGGTTTAPSATHPQGNPPASSAPGSQSAGTGATGEGNASWSKLDSNKDGYLSRDELKGDDAMSSRFSALDKDSDGRLSREEFNAHGSGMGATGSTGSGMGGTTGSGAGHTGSGSSGSMMGIPKSPSSGGEPQSGGAATSPKGAN